LAVESVGTPWTDNLFTGVLTYADMLIKMKKTTKKPVMIARCWQ